MKRPVAFSVDLAVKAALLGLLLVAVLLGRHRLAVASAASRGDLIALEPP